MQPNVRLCRRSSVVASVVVWLLVSPACSTDTSGLGDSAGHPGLGKGGAGGTVGTGGKGGTTGGSGGITNVGGKVGTGGSGGVVGTGGTSSTGGAAGGHAGAVASGGVSSGGKGGAGGLVGTGGKGGAAGGVVGSGGKGGGAAGGAVGSGGKGGGQAGAAGGKAGGAAGGAVGSGGAGGRPGSGGAGGAIGPECESASDCKLWEGCCVCQAQPVNSTPPADCEIACIQSQCKAEQLPSDAVDCVAGRCVAGFNCDASDVTCKVAVPACDSGYVPAVNAAGSCYTGGCVPASQCTRVTACSACGPNLECVIYQTQLGNQFHCVSRPAACKNSAACDCLGRTACTGAYRTCTELSGQPGIVCSCPNC